MLSALKAWFRWPQRILLVRHFAVGDVLFTTPFYKQLRKRYPRARIDLYSLVEGVLEPLDGFGAFIPMRSATLDEVLKRGYRRVYWFSYEQDPSRHILDGYEESTGLRPQDRTLTWKVLPSEQAAARARLADLPRPLIGFSPTSGHQLRSLPAEALQSWVDQIGQALGGTVVFTSDQAIELNGCANLSGKLGSMRELAAIVQACDAWLTIDSGPLHLAQALDVPAVGLFGCTLPELRATRPDLLHALRVEPLECLGCYHRIAPHAETLASCARGDLACMNGLEVDRAIEALKQALARQPDPGLLSRVAAYEAAPKIPADPRRTEAVAQTYRDLITAMTWRPPEPSFIKRMERSLRAWRKGLRRGKGTSPP